MREGGRRGGAWRAKKVALAVEEGSHKKRGDLEEEGEGIKGGGAEPKSASVKADPPPRVKKRPPIPDTHLHILKRILEFRIFFCTLAFAFAERGCSTYPTRTYKVEDLRRSRHEKREGVIRAL